MLELNCLGYGLLLCWWQNFLVIMKFLRISLNSTLFPPLMQGKMSCLMINDLDAGLGRFGEPQSALRLELAILTK